MNEYEIRFHSVNGKRRLLIVEDEEISRELLKMMLESEYELVFANDGDEAISKVKENVDKLSCILLDLNMPKVAGFEVLKILQANELYKDIPVIIASGDSSKEVECINAGAVDFLQKPYPEKGVILARIKRTIELSEGRRIISKTKRDSLTDLYNKEYLETFGEQYDHFHEDEDMDAIVLDINRFNVLNERYGREFGDKVLCIVANEAKKIFHENGGIIGRDNGDEFSVYCPHRNDYKEIVDRITKAIDLDPETKGRVRLRMGVYPSVDKTTSINHRLTLAKRAADTVKNNFNNNVAIYDETLRKKEVYQERLVDDFNRAIEEDEFEVYYQPKFYIQVDKPILNSAEALVRWKHSELGMVSPGEFIPLFEKNGLIQRLDEYVWVHAAKQIRKWKDELNVVVPISVNVSRIDMYDPDLIHTFSDILKENNLTVNDLHLEVTESAYTEDSGQIIETVKRLRQTGFQIEMDDFGTGYSSLNMINKMPIDALKLDMSFIKSAFDGKKDTHMLEVIVKIAKHLNVPSIAEGVETKEQYLTLKELGCDIIQGYYFSPPVEAKEFEKFLLEK